MFNPDTTPVSVFMPSLETAARSLKVALIITPVHGDEEIETNIIALGREPGGGLVVMPDGGFTTAHRAPIVSAAARNNVPVVYSVSDYGYGDIVPRQALARTLAIGIGVSGLFLTGLIAGIAVYAM
jgi:hypothetical protein